MTLGGVDLVSKHGGPAQPASDDVTDPSIQQAHLVPQQSQLFAHNIPENEARTYHVQVPSSGAVAPPMQQVPPQPHHLAGSAQQHLSQLQPTQLNGGDHAPATAMSFIPHRNLMPKTTGSQAHLLSIQEANGMKQYNSLNQTGKMVSSHSLTKNPSGPTRSKHKK